MKTKRNGCVFVHSLFLFLASIYFFIELLALPKVSSIATRCDSITTALILARLVALVDVALSELLNDITNTTQNFMIPLPL